MIKLRLVSEYLAGPIFCPDLDNMGHIDIEDLPVSEDLRNKINAWDGKYQATFNEDYPPDSGFKSINDNSLHIAEGKDLAEQLQIELGGGYIIEYALDL